MRMQDHLDSCKRQARKLKSKHPDQSYMRRLEIAAHEQGFRNYKVLVELHKLLGPDQHPSHLAITLAGGRSSDSPYRPVTNTVRLRWTSA